MSTPSVNPIPVKRTAFYERSHIYIPGNHVSIRAQIEGNVTEPTLQKIITKLQSRHFMLNVHIEIDSENRAWFVQNASPAYEIKVIQESTSQEWATWIKKEIFHPFAVFQGVMFRFLLFYDSSSNITDLIIIGQHSVCDGLSLIYLLRDILELLANPDKSLFIEPAPSLDAVIPLHKVKLPFLINKLFTRLIKLWQTHQIRLDPHDFTAFQSYSQDNPIEILPWELSPEITNLLHSAARSHGISVNSVIYTAFLLAQAEIQDTSASCYRKLFMPMNIRKKVGIGEALGLYATGNMSTVKVNPQNSFWENAKKAHSRLHEELKEKNLFIVVKRNYIMPESLIDARLMLHFSRILHNPPEAYNKLRSMLTQDRFLNKMFTANTQDRNYFGLLLTNLGQITIPREYGSYILKSVYFIPPSSFMAEKLLGIVTYQDSLRGSLVFETKQLSRTIAEKFLLRTQEILTSILQSS